MPTEIEIQITHLFSTPLLVFTPAHHERINAELSQLILAREASVPRHRSDPVVLASRPVDDGLGRKPPARVVCARHRSSQTSHNPLRPMPPCCPWTRLGSRRGVGQRSTKRRDQCSPLSPRKFLGRRLLCRCGRGLPDPRKGRRIADLRPTRLSAAYAGALSPVQHDRIT